jgi:hypothetical protein
MQENLLLSFCGFNDMWYNNTYCTTIFSEPYTPVSFLPTAAYIIPEIGANDFYNSYNRGLSPQDVIDMILPQSLSSLLSAVEVTKIGTTAQM